MVRGHELLRQMPLQKVTMRSMDGWGQLHTSFPTMPGITADSHGVGETQTRKKWAMEMSVPHGGLKRDFPADERSVTQGPRALEQTVTDASGLPTSADPREAAEWKVKHLGRVDKRYAMGNQQFVLKRTKPKPRVVACNATARRAASTWQNFLGKVSRSSADPLHRDLDEEERFARTRQAEVDFLVRKAAARGQEMRAKTPKRPWDRNRAPASSVVEEEMLTQEESTDAFAEQHLINPGSVWLFAWVSEWDTQIKMCCPWDKKLVIHRSTAELPWVLEQDWNSPEAARELVKDCIEDFHQMCKKKNYEVDGTLECQVLLNGHWIARRGVLNGLNDSRSRLRFGFLGDNTPIPVDEVEDLFPKLTKQPGVALYRLKVGGEDHQQMLPQSRK